MLAFFGSLGLRHYGAAQYQAGYAAAVAVRAQADAAAVAKRLDDNKAAATHQATSNATITEEKHEELQPVRERIVTQRVHIGSAVCGDRPTGAAEAEGTGSGHEADPPGRLVRADVERDLVALKLAVEEDLATGRACQRVLQDEGMVP
jgi:hypothetical protein